jgi:pimeloyl-ACP methyl ester carboxylesterase
MSEEINHGRRHLVGAATLTIAAAQLGMAALADAHPRTTTKVVQDVTDKSEPVERNTTVVLVHGAWADGSSWARVITPLRSRGVRWPRRSRSHHYQMMLLRWNVRWSGSLGRSFLSRMPMPAP